MEIRDRLPRVESARKELIRSERLQLQSFHDRTDVVSSVGDCERELVNEVAAYYRYAMEDLVASCPDYSLDMCRYVAFKETLMVWNPIGMGWCDVIQIFGEPSERHGEERSGECVLTYHFNLGIAPESFEFRSGDGLIAAVESR